QGKKVILVRRSDVRFLVLKGELEETDYLALDDTLARNKNRIRIETEDLDELPEPIRWKLFLIRQLALFEAERIPA
ncbi:hypothetical protein EB118_16700, partial [bacterium]|nr:hypothetical protein [bacterium]